jgi:protein-S-isoprenylcysteine O-methyltransferase Ste14
MHPETAFRLAVAAVMVGSMAIAGYHRFQAAKSRERISRREEGWALFASIRLSGLLLLIGVVSYLINPGWVRWASLPIPPPVRWVGAPLGAASTLLLYWTLSTLGSNLTDTVVTRLNHSLMTSGPYRWVRHPFYVSLFLLVGATAILAANWFIAASGLLVFVLLAIRTPTEERKLFERFGDEYRSYSERTGRFVPRVWRPAGRL